MDRRLVILVEFELHPGKEPEFRQLVLENAAASLRDEPGCSLFDVLTPEGGPSDRIVLYEIYDDAAAFDVRRAGSVDGRHQYTSHAPGAFDRVRTGHIG